MIEELNKETLKRLYLKEGKSLLTIAKMFGCSFFKVRYRCVKYGIKLRPRSGRKIIIKKSVLQKLYVKEGKPSNELEEILSCSYKTILERCKEHGIPFRKPRVKGITKALLQKLYVKEGKTIREIASILNCSREAVRERCKKFGIPLRNPGTEISEIDEATIRRLYVKEKKSINEIARILGCAASTIFKRVKRFKSGISPI